MTCFGERVPSTGRPNEELSLRSGLSHTIGPFYRETVREKGNERKQVEERFSEIWRGTVEG